MPIIDGIVNPSFKKTAAAILVYTIMLTPAGAVQLRTGGRIISSKGLPASRYNSIANICLLTAEENQTIGTRRPRYYLGEVKDNGTYFKRKMARNLIPVHADSGVWKTDVKRGFNQFVKERTDLICKALETEAGGRLFRRDR